MTSTSLTPSLPHIDALLQHRGTMLLLDCVITYDQQSIIAEYTPRPDAWYADNDSSMPGWFGIELMAQTIAAHVGVAKQKNGMPVKHGFLLGTRRYNSLVSHFAADRPLRIQATISFNDESGLGAYECKICSDDDRELASATLKVYEPDDVASLINRNINE